MRVEHIPKLARDIAGMEDFYPQFRLVVPLIGPVHWRGTLRPYRTRLDTYEVVVEYGPVAGLVPRVWIVGPEISRRTHPFHPHLNSDGSACTFFVPDQTFDPDRDDVGRLVDLVGDWLRRNTFFELVGWWPGKEAPHNASDVLTELARTPDARCVCGMPRPFRLCCRARYQRAARAEGTVRRSSDPALVAEQRRVGAVVRAARAAVGPLIFAACAPHLGPPLPFLMRGAEVPAGVQPRQPDSEAISWSASLPAVGVAEPGLLV